MILRSAVTYFVEIDYVVDGSKRRRKCEKYLRRPREMRRKTLWRGPAVAVNQAAGAFPSA